MESRNVRAGKNFQELSFSEILPGVKISVTAEKNSELIIMS